MVYYASYPRKRREKRDWWAVIKVKARHIIEGPSIDEVVYQEDEIDVVSTLPFEIDEIVPLNDPSGAYETIEFNEIIPDEDDETASISQSIDEEEEGEDDFEDTMQDSVESYDDDSE
ncbi:hypothetical protein Dimus_010213 [Dionaea muscipula]